MEALSNVLRVKQSRSKAGGSPKVYTLENWEQIVEEILLCRTLHGLGVGILMMDACG